MPSTKSSVFAPRWVRCFASVFALAILPAVLAVVAVFPDRWPLIVPTPIFAYVFLIGLDCLMLGRPQQTMFSMIADLVRGRFQATHDTRRNGD